MNKEQRVIHEELLGEALVRKLAERKRQREVEEAIEKRKAIERWDEEHNRYCNENQTHQSKKNVQD